MATDSGVRGRLARIDPMIPVLCAVATAVYLLHGFGGFLSRDLGVYAYGAEQFARGVPPYVAIVNRAGPLAHLIPGLGALAARGVGVDEILGMRVLMMLLAVAAVAVTYALGRDLFRSRLAGLAGAASLIGCEGFIIYASGGPREKTSMVLFLLCALLAMVHRRWATMGYFTALATLCWQPVLLAAAAGALTSVLLGPPAGRVRALVRFVGGGLVPAAVTVVVYAALGHLDVLLDDFLLINARYTKQSSLIMSPDAAWRVLDRGYGSSLGVLIAGLLAMVVLAAAALVRLRRGRDAVRADVVAIGAVLVVGLAWSLRAFDGSPDAFVLLPPAHLGIAGLAAVAAARLPLRTAAGVVAAWALVAVGMGATFAVTTRSDLLDAQRAAVEAVLAELPPGARILSVNAPQPLVLAHQRNLSRLQLFGNGLVDYVDATWPGGSDGYGEWVAIRAPTLIAVGNHGAVPPWLRPIVREDYHRVGPTVGWVWFVNDRVGPDKRAQLAEVVRDTWRSVAAG